MVSSKAASASGRRIHGLEHLGAAGASDDIGRMGGDGFFKGRQRLGQAIHGLSMTTSLG
jgi:hypothetical protein